MLSSEMKWESHNVHYVTRVEQRKKSEFPNKKYDNDNTLFK